MPKFRDIKKYTRAGSYQVDVSWDYLERCLEMWSADYGVELDPDFQRAHVWTPDKQIRYVEHVLRGGQQGKVILWNCPTFGQGGVPDMTPVVLVDGKQRLNAVRKFMADDLPVFGHKLSEYEDRLRGMMCTFKFQVNDLLTRAEVLQWYLDVNDGGVVHTSDEIEKVRRLLAAEVVAASSRAVRVVDGKVEDDD